MKILIVLSKNYKNNNSYKMCIVETDEIKDIDFSQNWQDLDAKGFIKRVNPFLKKYQNCYIKNY